MPSVTSHRTTPREILWWLQSLGERPATFQTIVELYRENRDRFYELACIGVSDEADAWAKEIANVAALVRGFVRHGFEIETAANRLVGPEGQLYLGDAELAEAPSFLQEIAGTHRVESGRDYVGSDTSQAEIEFNIGSSAERTVDEEQSLARNAIKPKALRLDEQDVDAIKNGMPAYVVHELLNCAPRIVQAPTSVFQGVRIRGKLAAGKAYCGKPRRAFDNNGTPVQPPSGMVYCVYVDPEGFVFDWDWVKEHPSRPGYPSDYAVRFANQVTEIAEAVLLRPSVQPGQFKPGTAWHSLRGDCMFFYASEEHAYAARVNQDLTEYRSIETEKVVGCKVKNFDELLSKITEPRPVPVGAVLAASLVRQMEDHQQQERKRFIRLISEVASKMEEQKRGEFLRALADIDPTPNRYLEAICQLALKFTLDTSPIETGEQAAIKRRAVEDTYVQLIAVAGSATVAT